MIRTLFTGPAVMFLAACAGGPGAPARPAVLAEGAGAVFTEAALIESGLVRPVEIVETATPLPLPGQMKPVTAPSPAPAVSPATAVSEGTRAARIEPSTDGYVNAIQVYPYTEGALYRLYTSPGQVSDIALQPGEELVSVSAGDTVRWVVGDTVSGAGAGTRAHVLVKPVAAGLSTNLMIATDRRTYHLELTSLEAGYMAALSWRYPADQLAELTHRNARALSREAVSVTPDVRLADLNFGYRIDGDTPPWRPLRVFDDGRQVFIQMPAELAATDAPPLFVLSTQGSAELVNYRVRGTYYIVDTLFETAELRLGRKPQTVVRIRRQAPGRGAGRRG